MLPIAIWISCGFCQMTYGAIKDSFYNKDMIAEYGKVMTYMMNYTSILMSLAVSAICVFFTVGIMVMIIKYIFF
jgi:hypothetical protein